MATSARTKRKINAAERRDNTPQDDDPQDFEEAITCTLSPADRITGSPEYVDASKHTDKFCSDKVCTGGSEFFSPFRSCWIRNSEFL